MTTERGLPPRTLYEHGLTRAALGQDEPAIEALRLAVAAKPAMSEAWQALADLLGRRGDSDGACAAMHAAQRENPDPVRAKPAAPGKLDAAERQWRDRLRGQPAQTGEAALTARLLEYPVDAPALRLLGERAAERGDISRAERLLRRALEVAPGYSGARHRLALLLFHSAQEARAIPLIERLLADEPRHLGYRVLLASSFSQVGEYDRTIALYEAVLKDAPGEADILVNYAQACKHAGRRAESVRALRQALRLAPGHGEAWWNLANLKNEVFSAEDIAAMRARIASATLAADARIQLHYALGRALEQDRQYGESFAQYSEGARHKQAATRYSAAATHRHVQRSMAVFSSDLLAAGGCEDGAPIFILGLPRAGSTLIEQILASHSAVEGTMELPEIHHIARDLAAGRDAYPECVANFSGPARAALGARFIERTRIYRKTNRPFFIDKMPSNWAYAGLILAILPRAKIIDARRAAMASCWSAFKQYLPGGSGFPCGLADLGRYYRDYEMMMAHFGAVAPGRIHRVQYERMVEDTEAETRRLLAYCGLAFEPNCLRFWETRRAVSTASSEQVRQPIFRDGLDQWRNYAPWLGPLAEALGVLDADAA